MYKRIIAILIAAVVSMAFFVACDNTSTDYDNDSSSYVDYSGRCNYIMYKSSGEIIKVDSCVYYAGIDVYEVTINGWVSYIPSDEIELLYR